MALTTEEEMAVAVLRGDKTAAKMLSDRLQDEYAAGATQIPSVQKITVPVNQLRIVVYMRPSDADIVVDPAFRTDIEEWVRDGGALVCSGVERVEIFELPQIFLDGAGGGE